MYTKKDVVECGQTDGQCQQPESSTQEAISERDTDEERRSKTSVILNIPNKWIYICLQSVVTELEKKYLIELNITQLFAFPHFGIKRGNKIITIFTLNSTKHIVYGD